MTIDAETKRCSWRDQSWDDLEAGGHGIPDLMK